MTKQEAKLFFPSESSEDLDDLWEQRLFEQKQFFLTRTPLVSVFQARLKKMEKQHEAYLTLSGQKETGRPFITAEKHLHQTPSILGAFNSFHQERNALKQRLLITHEFSSVKAILNAWIQLEKLNYDLWKNPVALEDDIEVLKSKEPDPMELLEHIKLLSTEKEIQTFDELHSSHFELPEFVRKEVKRLTLLAQE